MINLTLVFYGFILTFMNNLVYAMLRYNSTIIFNTDYGDTICCTKDNKICSLEFSTSQTLVFLDYVCVDTDDHVLQTSIGCFLESTYAKKFNLEPTIGNISDYNCMCAAFGEYENSYRLISNKEPCVLTRYSYNQTVHIYPDDFWSNKFYPCLTNRRRDVTNCPLSCEGHDEGIVCTVSSEGYVKNIYGEIVAEFKDSDSHIVLITMENPTYDVPVIYEDYSGSQCSVTVKHDETARCDRLTLIQSFYVGNWTCLSWFHKGVIVVVSLIALIVILWALSFIIPSLKKVFSILGHLLCSCKAIGQKKIASLKPKKIDRSSTYLEMRDQLDDKINQYTDVEIVTNDCKSNIMSQLLRYRLATQISNIDIRGEFTSIDEVYLFVSKNMLLKESDRIKGLFYLPFGRPSKLIHVDLSDDDYKLDRLFADNYTDVHKQLSEEDKSEIDDYILQKQNLLSRVGDAILIIAIAICILSVRLPRVLAMCETVLPTFGSGYNCVNNACTISSAFKFKLFQNSAETCYEFMDDNNNLVYKLRLNLESLQSVLSLRRIYYTYDHNIVTLTAKDRHALSSRGNPYWMNKSGHCKGDHCEWKSFSIETISTSENPRYYINPVHDNMKKFKNEFWKYNPYQDPNNLSSYKRAHQCMHGIGEWWSDISGCFDYYCFVKYVPDETNLLEVFDLVPELPRGLIHVYEQYNGIEQHYSAKVSTSSNIPLSIGTLTILATDPDDLLFDSNYKIVYEHKNDKWWYAPAASWNTCHPGALGESQYKYNKTVYADVDSMTCCYDNLIVNYGENRCTAVYTKPSWRLDPNLYLFPHVKINGRTTFLESAERLIINHKDTKGLDVQLLLSGNYTVYSQTDIPNVEFFKFNCTNYNGGQLYTEWTYQCKSNTGFCTVRTEESNAMRNVELFTCDGAEHSFNASTYQYENLWCGDLKVNYKCQETTVGTFTGQALQVVHHSDGIDFSNWLESLDFTGFSNFFEGFGANLGERILTIIEYCILICVLIAIGFIIFKVIWDKCTAKKHSIELQSIASTPDKKNSIENKSLLSEDHNLDYESNAY